jgi:DNA-binding MarR family transcriptional regulator/predicted transcriptional regulator
VGEEEPSRGGDGVADPPRPELQRARKLVTAVEAVRRHPAAALSAAVLNDYARVSRRKREEQLEGYEACLLAAFEQVLALAAERANAAFQAQEGWLDRIRSGLLAVLEFFDEEPALARYCVVHSAQGGPAVLRRRGEALDRVARVLDDERAPARAYPPPLAAQAIVSGALGVLHARLSQPDAGVLVELAGPLMSFIVLPFLGARAARGELHRPVDASAAGHSVSSGLLQHPGKGLSHHRTVLVLRVVATEPGLNNREVALRAGLKDEGAISRILARMARLGLIKNTRDARSPVPANAWQLTASGVELERAIRHEASPGRVTFDLPEAFRGRLDQRAVPVLRIIGDQPRLTGREVALRAGAKDPAHISKLLKHLVRLGLIASERDVHRKGTPNAWRLTALGVELDSAVGRETPPPPRSLARDLMWESGGRLSDHAVSVLRVSAAEPGLSNNDIALRVEIADENSMSRLLARLARRGLIENLRTGGQCNVWQLSAAGIQLESAIRQETPEPVARRLALDLLKNRGGRLTHRTVLVLGAIGAEPGLSNDEIARRAGVNGRSTTSTLLARCARFGLIENIRTSGRKNVWRLTASGIELERALRHDTQVPDK